ncbi:MAG TPA: hypothetical protein ENJ60_11045 [Aeromonadales bacterium]|nr:hypothetical protein [Aeromonadales bacterium]
MAIKIYHQVGHFSNWNIESYTNDKCGDGLIFSPLHQNKSQLEKIDDKLKAHSLFDPQYYLPNSQKKKLSTYPFFPEEISGGFSTIDFTSIALESARQCVAFQIEQNYEKIIIPARFIDQMSSDYLEQQEAYSVYPFLQALGEQAVSKPIYLTLPLTSHMIEDDGFRKSILNWVTGFPEIDGVYILVNHERNTKQIQSESFLDAYLEMLTDLSSVELGLIIGHTNTESLLFSLIDDSVLTFGSFENTRIFSVDKFVSSDEAKRGPKARIYLPGLLNWVQFTQAREIKNEEPELWSNIYQPTNYGNHVFNLAVEPYFNQPNLYKHHFICFYDTISTLSKLDVVDRYKFLKTKIQEAIDYHKQVNAIPINLDRHGNGEHLEHWLNCINRYYRKYLK